MKTVNNLASLKRAIKQTNVQIRVISHYQPQLVGTIRKPTKVQTNGYWFDGPRFSDSKVIRMFADIPKAAELQFNEDGSITFYPTSEKNWTIKIEEER